jgi:hypothetical protein
MKHPETPETPETVKHLKRVYEPRRMRRYASPPIANAAPVATAVVIAGCSDAFV